MSSCVMLAKSFDPKAFDPTGMWMSEKKNGERVWWNGNALLTRYGNPVPGPRWFIEALPTSVKFDGELFLPGGSLQELRSIVSTHGVDKGWNRVILMPFGTVDTTKLFEERYADVKAACEKLNSPYVQLLQQVRCPNHAFMMEAFKAITEAGGEGIVLCKPRSRYVYTRAMFKLRKFYEAEAKITGYKPGEGKYTGMMGALLCEALYCPSCDEAPKPGTKFKVGTGFDDPERKDAERFYPIGSVITYQFSQLTPDGKPFHPSLIAARPDYKEQR